MSPGCSATSRTAPGCGFRSTCRAAISTTGNVAEDVREALDTHGLAADCLILEVTESLLLENSARLERTFHELKTIGVRLALDDFGTGYSSLAYLHRFPIDILKIDRSFVERLARESGNAEGVDAVALAKAILSLADALGLDTVAEGIEHEAQRDTLLALGCKTGQGYLVRQGHARRRSASKPPSRAAAACWPATCRATSSTPPPAGFAA